MFFLIYLNVYVERMQTLKLYNIYMYYIIYEDIININ